jgi:hypothetical protein
MKAFGWPLKPRVKRLRPLLLLLAFALWGLTLTWVAREARSWPSRGILKQLTFTCDRPPLTEPGLTRNQDLDQGFEDETRRAFERNGNAVIDGPDAASLQNRSDYDVRKETHPLRKEWTLTAAGESPAAVSDRLLQVCQGMITRLPDDLKNSATFDIRYFNVTRMGTHFNISTSDIGILTGALMTLAGLLAALCHGKSRAGHLLVAVPAAMAGTLLFPMDHWVHSLGGITPASNDLGGDGKLTAAALKPLAVEGQQKSEYDTCYRWIDACLRLDKATADTLAGIAMSTTDWKSKAAFWLDNHLISVQLQEYSSYLSSAGRGEPIVSFSCLVFARGPDKERYQSAPRDYGYGFTSQSQASRLTLKLTKKGDTWTVSQ